MSQRQRSGCNPVPSEEGAIVGVDLAKTVFQLCIADSNWHVRDAKRLSRHQFEQFFINRDVALVVMEACGTAHHWARWLQGLGIQVQLIPAQYVRAYVRRNKTDAADAAALLEAARCAEIRPVRVKSVEQQALQTLHRTRAIWVATRTARINALRGFCREFGIAFAQGARRGIEQIGKVVADTESALPALMRGAMALLVDEVRELEARIGQLERELAEMARHSPACKTLLSIPGVGLITATAIVAATAGDVSHFNSARHFGSWLGLTPREHSSANARHLHGISKRGDNQLRVLLTHGARSVLRMSAVAQAAGRPLDRMRNWAMRLQERSNHNKAACAVANKLARICYATLRDGKPYLGPTAAEVAMAA
jgi:transposase